MNPGQADELAAAVRELQRLVAAQAVEIADLRAQLETSRTTDDLVPERELQVTGRRRFLALAGGAAAAAVATLAVDSSPAAAATGDPVEVGESVAISAGVAETTLIDYSPATSGQVDYLRVTDNNAPITSVAPPFLPHLPGAVAGHARTTNVRVRTGVTGFSEVEGGNGVLGIATGPSGSYGVWGISDSGYGVVGRGPNGYDFYAEGSGRVGLVPHVGAGPPATGTYATSDIIADSQAALWTCVIAGAPGVWRKLAGPTTAGAFHAVTPTRVYDSRSPEPDRGHIRTGEPRTVSVADGRAPGSGEVIAVDLVPPGATAVACNITVTDTFGDGFAVVNPGSNDNVGASTINWQSGQVLANSIIVGIDDARRVTLVVGAGAAANIVVDVSGYFR